MNRAYVRGFIVFGILTLCAVLFAWASPIAYLSEYMYASEVFGYVIFVGLLVVATVCAPITVLPIIPIGTHLFGPFMTGLLSVVGWSIGAGIAFFISRRYGRPMLTRFGMLEKVERLISTLPQDMRFTILIILRMVVPVDIASYALGLVKGIGFFEYMITTIIGVAYFSFVFAYLSSAVFAGDILFFSALGVVSAVLFYGCWAILMRHARNRE